MATQTVTHDIEISHGGSIALVTPLTDAGREWINDNLQVEAWQWMGCGSSLAVEPRCAQAIRDGAIDAGLEVL